MVIKSLASPNELLWLMGIPGLLGRKGGEVLIAAMESCLRKSLWRLCQKGGSHVH